MYLSVNRSLEKQPVFAQNAAYSAMKDALSPRFCPKKINLLRTHAPEGAPPSNSIVAGACGSASLKAKQQANQRLMKMVMKQEAS